MIPRVLNYWAPGDYTAALGIGKLITSVTMTLFYLLMEYARRERYKNQWRKAVDDFRMGTERYPYRALLISAERMDKRRAVAFVGNLEEYSLCRNRRDDPVMLWFKSAKDDKPLKFAWLAVTLSFAFYLPVVLWSQMLPKTCMYIWLILMFKNAGRSKQRLS